MESRYNAKVIESSSMQMMTLQVSACSTITRMIMIENVFNLLSDSPKDIDLS